VESAEAAVLSSRALPNPRFEWQTGPSRQLASGYSGAAQTLIIAQPIENPSVRESRRQVAESGVEVARQTRQVVRNDIAARIKTLASEIEYRQQEALHFAESLALLEQIRERVRRRVEIGEAARYELIKADAEIVTARQRARQATLMIDRVRLAIERLGAGRLPAGWSLQPTWSEALSLLELPAAAELRPDRNPELKLLEQRADQAQRGIALARASVVPAVDLIVSRNREPDLSKNTVGLAVSVPVFDQRQGPIAQARADAGSSSRRSC
jgi:cobalt-zinc-cadmium efflux system outer membrane protein